MSVSNRLALPLLDAAQAQKHVTHNEALVTLDSLVQLSVSARGVLSPSATPAEGDRVIVGTGANGAFAGHDGSLAAFDNGGWAFLVPRAGWQVYVVAERALFTFDGTAWVAQDALVRTLQNLVGLGVGTTSDATNRLAAKLNAALFTALGADETGTGDLRMVLNKSTVANTVSQLYQSNYSGRAETGLSGSDDFAVKVSSDGVSWKTGLKIAAENGVASFPSGVSTKTFCDVSLDAGATTYGGPFTRVPLNIVNADPGNNWDNTNHWYLCPRAGLYMINGTLRVGPGGDASAERGYQYGLGVYTSEADGPWFLWHAVGSAPAIRSTYPYARLSYQNAGDCLRMFTYSDQGVVVFRAGLQIVYVGND